MTMQPKSRPRNQPFRKSISHFKSNALLTLLAVCGCASGPVSPYPESDHYRDGTFFNAKPITDLNFFQILGHVLWGRNGEWKNDVTFPEMLQLDAPLDEQTVALTWVGHASLLIQVQGVHLLTDPVWSERVGPFSWAGPKRAHPPGIPFEKLPRVDVILISHNHYDHMDLPTLRRLSERDAPLVIVPLGNKTLLMEEGISNVVELDWWGYVQIHSQLRVTLTPSQHNSGRGLFDRGRSLWGSFLIRSFEQNIYFAGDTAYESHFSEIRRRLGAVSVALLPIGAYEPREKMKRVHMDPQDAVQAAQDLDARVLVPMHYSCFQLTGEDYDAPLMELQRAWVSERQKSRLQVLVPGQTQMLRGGF